MSTRELAGRVRDQGRHWAWRRRQVPPGEPRQGDLPRLPPGDVPAGELPLAGGLPPGDLPARPVPLAGRLPPGVAATVSDPARQALVDAASGLLQGRWEIFGVIRDDLAAPDWFLDPVTGRRAPQEPYAFGVDTRSEEQTGNVKQVWELSRHHHLTVLAAAWLLTGDDRYAHVVDRQLRSWWRENPFLSGVHWTSGIELGIRLIAWTWIRRLLDGWPGVTALFEGNQEAVRQLYWHQEYLAGFQSRGSSANNHVIAEAAGRLVASCAFGWFPESDRWRESASRVLERELERNTFRSGVNRELASDYHCLVAELGMIAVVEAEAAGHPQGEQTWTRLCRMVDAAAAIVDERLGPPRQGDGDDGQALLVDAPAPNHWESMLALGTALFGGLAWWPATPAPDVRSALIAALAGSRAEAVADRPAHRPSHFADAGLTLLRSPPRRAGPPGSGGHQGAPAGPEIWCRCDGGPHGYLSIAAHAHADALAIEVRHGGVEVLADPGTYCYHGEPQWRAYFRSTLAHNTLELDGQDQSQAGGPFLWVQAASTHQLHAALDTWSAEHDGYRRLDPPAIHRRTVHLDADHRRLEIQDRVLSEGSHRCRLAFHLGPSVEAVLDGGRAVLTWPVATGAASAIVSLPHELRWQLHRGETEPILGWYSSGFGRKTPTVSLIGSGTLGSSDGDIVTVIDFRP